MTLRSAVQPFPEREVGALLHLPGSSVYHLARRGAIPGHRVGRAWRFIRHEIEDWLRAS